MRSSGTCCSGLAGGCAKPSGLECQESEAPSPASVERGVPRCSTSGLSPSTSSPRRIPAKASLLTLESHRALVSEHTSGRWRHFGGRAVAEEDAAATSRRLGSLRNRQRVRSPAWFPAVVAVLVHALAEDGTVCSTAMARPDRQARYGAQPPSSTLLLHHLLTAASRLTILLCDSVHVQRRRFRLSRIQGEVGPRGGD